VAVVRAVKWDPVAAGATVHRELEGGLVELLWVPAPALLTIQTGINEPRYPNLRAIKQAREKPLAVLGLDDLDVDAEVIRAAAGAQRITLTPPDAASQAEMLEGSASVVAARILEIVDERLSA
jgi:electron transfer flavoprotein beta subunit